MKGCKPIALVVKLKVKDGKSINVLKDVWLMDKCLIRWPTFVLVNLMEDTYLISSLLMEAGI
ncbi:hypothetical protein MA16_Dca006673 [Dendrobium catenatum]|uniref:Uncharacterized protein n=1 Tax=Dendrobium catenatum TaxID=906689 RepID=A0A2I0X5T4_9ASPA|nr:hypothetical protein MA16_Dca006673 [Dendrobium catenatum]